MRYALIFLLFSATLLAGCQAQPTPNDLKSYCTENVGAVERCGDTIGVVSKLLGGGTTFIKPDKSTFQCPIVAPEYITEDCKAMMKEGACSEQINC